MTRGFKGNAVHSPVHVFYSNAHDPRCLASSKRHLTATVYESFARQKTSGGYQVLVASSNEVLSWHVEGEHNSRMEVVPLVTAKHMAELMGIGLVVLEGVHCDVRTADTWWDLYYYTPRDGTRNAIGREMLM
jgi:hypothetical protein